MVNLLVYALLISIGFDVENEYKDTLDTMFLENPDNDDLLELQYLTGNIKESVIYICSHIDYKKIDIDKFGKVLMEKLKSCYEKTAITDFAPRMYKLWKNLPEDIKFEDPFYVLCYGDEPLSWGDEKQTRKLYESMLNHYKK